MKRGLRIVTGLVVMLALVLAAGFLGNGKAWADDGNKHISEEKSWDEEQLAALISRYENKLQEQKSAKNDIDIISNTSVTSRIYDANVWIWNNATYTVGTNGNIVINGDLVIRGKLNISSGTLTVNGDLVVDTYGRLTASGTAKIIVNKAAAGGVSGYYGGNLIVWNDLMGYFGTLDIKGSANVTVNKVTVNNIVQNSVLIRGCLLMSSATAKLTANVNTFIADGYGSSSTPYLTAGTIVINGNFLQDDTVSDNAYCPSPGFNTIIQGTAATPRKVLFMTSDASYLTNFTFSGVVFTTDSWVSIKKTLAANMTINGNNSNIEFQGDLNGYNLTIISKNVFATTGSPLYFKNGCLTVNGNFVNDVSTKITMVDPADKIIVNGNFLTVGSYSTFDEGRLEVNGNFLADMSSGNGWQEIETFTPSQNFTTMISGSNRLIDFNYHESSYFSNLVLGEGTTLDPLSVISLNTTLNNDLTLPCTVYFRGAMGNHSLTANTIYIPGNSSMDVQDGLLTVNGNMTVYGRLKMNNPGGTVVANGDFLVSGSSSTGNYTNGRLFLKGDFTQVGTYSAASFRASDSHMTILNGSEPQNIQFGTGNVATGSKFAKLIVLNDTLDTGAIPAFYDELIVTGTDLDGIAASTGALSPAFDADTADYTLLLPEGTDDVTITPSPDDKYGVNASMTINGVDNATSIDVTDVPDGGTTIVTIVVHAYDDLAEKTYTIEIQTINRDLGSLGTLPDGALMEPAFNPGTLAYTVQLPENAASFTFAPVKDHPNSTMTIDGTSGAAETTVTLALEGSSTYTVRVVGQDGTTEKAYTVTFTRRNPLTGINVSGGALAPTFDAGTTAYTVNVPTNMPTVTVTAVKNNTDWSKFTINDGEQSEITLPLDIGESKTATIKAWDSDGKTVTTYTVTLTRVSMLSGITLSTGTLTPAFNGNIESYSVYLPSTAASVKITPVKTEYCTSMTIDGVAANDKTLSLTLGGKSTATIVCTNGTGAEAFTSTYTVDVYRVAPVTGITITGGTLSPAFAVTTAGYTVSVPSTTASVIVKPIVSAYCSDMQMDGQTVESVTLTPAIGGSAATVITSTGLDGKEYKYTVTVKRATLVKGITPYPGKLSPAFNATTLAYTVAVPYTTTQVKITPVKAATGVKSLTINGAAVSYAYVKPPLGGSAKAVIKAVGTDGKTVVAYTVTVIRAGLISGINLSEGALTPTFVGSTATYTINLPVTTPSVTVTPVKTSSCKSFTIDGRAVTSKVITPPAGGTTTCTIVATALNGITKSTYTVKVVRNRPITGIGLSTGTLSPAFSATQLAYDVTIPADQPSVMITPARTSGYNYTINGEAVNTPASISVAQHGAETANIVATYPGGSITYTLTVRRAEAPDNIQAISGALAPAFDNEVFHYEIHMDHATGPDTVSLGVTVTGDCSVQTSGLKAAKPAAPGFKVATITVTPAGGFTVTYRVTIYWD